MEKSINIFANSSGPNEKTLRAFAAIKKRNLALLDKLIAESKKNLTSPEFEDDIYDIIEFGKANRLDLQNFVHLAPPNANGPLHPYELDVLAAAIYYATEENQDTFDKLLEYVKAVFKDENKLKIVISDAFWIAARYGRLKIIEKLISEKPSFRNLPRWYIPEPISQPAPPLFNSVTTTAQPAVRRIVRRIAPPIISNNIALNNINKATYQVNCDALQIAIIANNTDVVKILLFYNFPCNNIGTLLYPQNFQPTLYNNNGTYNHNTALGLAKAMGSKELENMLLRTIYLQDAKDAFTSKNYPLTTSCFSLACTFDPANFKSLPNTPVPNTKNLWLENLSFIIEYLHTQVENAVEQNATANGDLQDYRFVLDFIKIFVNLFSTNNDPNFELLYKEFLKDVIEPLYAYDCSANNTKLKLFESKATKEAFFNKHSFLSEISFGKTHSEMQGTYNVNTNIGFFTVAAQNNPQPNNNANDSVINVQTPANKTL